MCNFKKIALLFMAIGLFTAFVGCNNKNDDVGPLREDVKNLRAELTRDFDAKLTAKQTELQSQLDAAKARLDQLQNAGGVSAEQLQAAKNEVLEMTVAKTAFDQYKESVASQIQNAASATELNAVKSNLENLTPRVATLETLVGNNKAALDKALADLKTELNGTLSQEVAAFQSKLDAQKTELQTLLNSYKAEAKKGVDANAAAIKALNDKLAAAEKALNVNVVRTMLNSRLTSLVFIPDFVSDRGGALPLVSFAGLRTEECGEIAPSGVVLKYQLNPSSVKLSDIKKDEVVVKYNAPTVAGRKGEVTVKASNVSIENGILRVTAVIDNLSNLYGAQDPKINQLQVRVPLAGEDDVFVSSDWVKVDYSSKGAAIVKSEKVAGRDRTADYQLPTTVAAAKALNPDSDLRVVDLAVDKSLDLNQVVKAVYNSGNWADITGFGLSFKFDLNDENGQPIIYNRGVNNTNQQEFISLNDKGVASARVYTQNGNSAAVGRTPIVRVLLKSGDCVVKEGFLKINIVPREIPAVPPINIGNEGNYQAQCGAVQTLHRVGTQEMNEKFYHAVDMSKTDFHTVFRLEQEAGGVGTIREIRDADDPTSYNLVYQLTENEVWSNIGKVVTKSAVYTNGGRNVIKVTFSYTITVETVRLNIARDNYFDNNWDYIKLNVAVPDEGSEDSSRATFAPNLNNAFLTTAPSKVLTLNKPGYTYEYVFAEQQPTLSGVTLSVSSNGKELIATKDGRTETIARLLPQSAANGDVIEYQRGTLAKELLNKDVDFVRANVKLVVKNTCRKAVKFIEENIGGDTFQVRFLRPVNVEPNSVTHFVDGVDFGAKGSVLNMNDVVKLSDWRNIAKSTENYFFLPNHENYYRYYDVRSVTVDVTKITPEGLKVGGSAVNKLPETIEVEQTAPTQEYPFGTLTYRNNGTNLVEGFTLKVPVTVEYKWGRVSTMVRVPVKVTSANARKVRF